MTTPKIVHMHGKKTPINVLSCASIWLEERIKTSTRELCRRRRESVEDNIAIIPRINHLLEVVLDVVPVTLDLRKIRVFIMNVTLILKKSYVIK